MYFDNPFTGTYTFIKIFFFQAEDGIRDTSVTGVQTCALPISNEYAGKGGHDGHSPHCGRRGGSVGRSPPREKKRRDDSKDDRKRPDEAYPDCGDRARVSRWT